MKNRFLFSLMCISFLFAQADINISYEMKYGDGVSVTNNGNKFDEIKFNEHYFDANIGLTNNLFMFFQLQYSDSPLMGIERKSLNNTLTNAFLEYIEDEAYLKLGSIHTIYGYGLGLNTYKDRNADFDNGIYGVELGIDLNSLQVFFVGGERNISLRSNPVIVEPDMLIDSKISAIGFNYYLSNDKGELFYLFKNESSLIDSSTMFRYNVEETSRENEFQFNYGERVENIDGAIPTGTTSSTSNVLGYGNSFGIVDVYFEKEWKSYFALLNDDKQTGSRLYGSIGVSFDNLFITYEYKNYNIPDDILTFSMPPIVMMETTSILVARNQHTVNFNEEVGHQLELNIPINSSLNLLTNFSLSYRQKGRKIIINNNFTFNEFNLDDSYYDLDINNPNEDFMDYFENSINYNVNYEYDYYDTPEIKDIMIFSEIDEVFSLFPYKQIYFELNGYTYNNKLYYKIGLDHLNEIIKYHPFENEFYFDSNNLALDYDNTSIFIEDYFNNQLNQWSENWEDIRLINFNTDSTEIAELNSGNILAFDWDYCGEYDCSDFNDADEYSDTIFFDNYDITFTDSMNVLVENYNDDLNYLPEFINEIISDNRIDSLINEISYSKRSALTIPTQFAYNLGGGSSLTLYLEGQWKKDEKINLENFINGTFNNEGSTTTEYINNYLSLSYNHLGKWSITYFDDREIKEVNNLGINAITNYSDKWLGVDLTYFVNDASSLSIFYGSQKGGRVCANGVCSDQPGFEDGFKVTYRNIF